MKLLYLDCGMGAAGDMLTAALCDLLPDPDAFVAEMNEIGLHGVEVRREKSEKCGILGSHISVLIHGAEEDEHHHHHSHLHDLQHHISHLHIPESTKKKVSDVYKLIAEAESKVHGVPVEQIHFHEVGTLDALADITAVCLLMERLEVERVIVSPVHVGSGQVRCAHGILPVPAPATAELLKGIPCYGGEIRGELCTPTGAALLKYFADSFGPMPTMCTEKIGYGMGKKDFPAANCVRAILGSTTDSSADILELCCNLDDMTPEAIAFAAEELLNGGALDVYTVPIGMKKSRPGTMLCVLCQVAQRETLLPLLFKHTTTLGVREHRFQRSTLQREEKSISTHYGEIRRKDSRGYGVTRQKYEYEDLAQIARENNLSLHELWKQLP